jgi:nicotinamidase-related amidase
MTRHPNILDGNNTVLVVVDMQEPFLRSIFERERVVANTIKLIRAAKALGVPVVTTLQYQARMGDVIPEVAEALPDESRIDKMTFSCCGVEPFGEALAAIGRRQILLTGVETHICVSQTAHDLLHTGYSVQVAEDGVSSRRESDWRTGVEKMRGSGVVITSCEAAIYEMLRDASAAEFKQILDVVK